MPLMLQPSIPRQSSFRDKQFSSFRATLVLNYGETFATHDRLAATFEVLADLAAGSSCVVKRLRAGNSDTFT